jgi:hypothetical protein
MNELFRRMGDSDGNFKTDFQGHGFHSRLFELACFGYLLEQDVAIDRTEPSPDFVVGNGKNRIAIEAVTSNPRDDLGGQQADIAAFRMEPLSEDEIVEKSNEEFPIRAGSALFSKLSKRYWDLPHCTGLPLVLAIGPFHEAGSVFYTDESLARYLYGVESFANWTERNGLFVREAGVRAHSFGGKTIPSNFFAADVAENISAVLFCNQFTVPRFVRLAAQAAGLSEGEFSSVEGHCLMEDEAEDITVAIPYRYRVGDGDFPPETWHRGVTIFHNPRARFPLPSGALGSTSSFRHRDGRLQREIRGVHTLTSFMWAQVPSHAPGPSGTEAEFAEARERARRTIEATWKTVARTRTLGWGGPIESVEERYRFVRASISAVRNTITPELPILIFQSRESPPEEMEIAVPYRDTTGNPYNTRIVSSGPLPHEQAVLLGEFAQAIWFALDQGILPPPRNGRALEEALLRWTDKTLLHL